MDKEILKMLSRSSEVNVLDRVDLLNAMIGAHQNMVSSFISDVEGGAQSEKWTVTLYNWSYTHHKELSKCKDNFYPTHAEVCDVFRDYLDETDKLTMICRRILEKDMRRVISSSLVERIHKER